MKRSNKSRRSKNVQETEDAETPSLLSDRLAARSGRARKAAAYRDKLINAALEQLGVNRKTLEQRADADFARARAESKARLLKLRKLQAARRKQRGPLRAQIAAAFERFEGMEALR